MDNSDPVHDIHLVRQDQVALFDSGEIFNPAFIDKTSNWSVLRFMDWNDINQSQITSWSQRGTVGQASWADVPIEVEVKLANETHSDMWLNIPAQADDDYIRQLATYVRDHLDPGLKLHLEYSNEVWNDTFSQDAYAQQQANALWGNGGTVNGGNEIYYGYRAAQMAAIAEQVFGADAATRFVGTLATFTFGEGVENFIFDGVARANVGSVSSLFKEYAVTTYFGGEFAAFGGPADQADDKGTILGWARSGAAGMDAAFQQLFHGGLLSGDLSLDALVHYYDYQQQVAQSHGLNMVAYEGGLSGFWFTWGADQGEIVDFIKRLEADPRMGQVYAQMASDFAAAGGTELTAFNDAGPTGIFGPWGTTASIYDTSPRYEALVAASGRVTGITTGAASYTMADTDYQLTYSGTGSFTGTGNASANIITGGDSGNHLYGAGGDDSLVGGAGADYLDGGTGADRMAGGAGNDIYIVDNAGDVVTELTGGGTDEVRTTLATYILPDNVENLTFTGTGNFTATGNALDNVITGGTGNDYLDGGAGADRLVGGAGDDIYIVDNAGDVVVELAGQGTDEVRTTLASYTLGDNLENLTFIGTGNFIGIGNALDNTITGGAGNDWLDGGTGNDLLIGGAGNDTYVVASTGDVVRELAGGGIDTVRTSLASYTLGANVENLIYTGSQSFVGTGNELDNMITGAVAAANHLYGGAGNDTLVGGSAADYLDGGTGIDTMTGGAGNDIYIADNAQDVVVELANGGVDEVRSTASSYALSANVENLTFIGTGAFTGTGNDSNNLITGGTGNDHLYGGAGIDTLLGGGGNDYLDGGTGADKMIGGLGDDTYTVDNVGDKVLENPGEGYDTVITSVTYTLPANIERLILAEDFAIDGSGNNLANVIMGNSSNNHIWGYGGNDYIDGGAGNDVIDGGDGNDTIIGGPGKDTLTGGRGTDTFVFRPGDLANVPANTDKVTDFSHSEGDRLDFSAYRLSPGTALSFIGGSTFGHHAGEVRSVASGGDFDISVDLDGDGMADIHLLVTSRTGALVSSDFIL